MAFVVETNVMGVVITSSPGADVERAKRDDEPHRAAARADHVRRRRVRPPAHEEAPELLLERRDLRAQREKQRVEHAPPRRGLLFAQLVPVELDLAHRRLRAHQEGPVDREVRCARSASRRNTYCRSVYQRRSSGSTAPSRSAASTSRMPSSTLFSAREAEHACDLLEAHVVVAQVGVGRRVGDLGARHRVADAEREVQDLHVALRRTRR